jgi:hypothetical protein
MNLVINCQTGEQNLVALSASELVERDANEQERIVEEAALPMKNLRQRRNQLLTETDYLALADVTLTDEMRSYRQALRDLPANTVDPANPVWPVKPGGN